MRQTTKSLLVVLVLWVAVAQWFGSQAMAQVARIAITQEFIYPTGFDTPLAGVGGGGGTTSIPRDFKTREIGTILTVYNVSVTGPGEQRAIWINALKQQKELTGNSDLMIAAATGDTSAAKQLIAAGADVNVRNRHGSTALMGAAAGGHVEIVKQLLAKKAAIDAQGEQGATALMFAARNGHLPVVETLLKNGAKLDLADNKQQTALVHAKQGDHEPVIELLIAAKSK